MSWSLGFNSLYIYKSNGDHLLLSMSPNLVLQLLLLLLRPPASEPVDDNLPLPEELSLWALGEAHMGLPPAEEKDKNNICNDWLPQIYSFHKLKMNWVKNRMYLLCPGMEGIGRSPLPEADAETAAKSVSLSLLSAAALERTYWAANWCLGSILMCSMWLKRP